MQKNAVLVTRRRIWAVVVLGLALGGVETGPLHAQSASPVRDDSGLNYRRESFRYPGASRPDPFRPLVGSAEVGVRLEDLTLRGVIYHPDTGRSVAVIARTGEDRPLRAVVGDRIGGIRLVAIRPGAVDLLVEELGVARRETLTLSRGQAIGVSND
jgi:hypothetical protein